MDAVDAPANAAGLPGWAAKHGFSADAYHRMGETGILHPADRIELIDGEIVATAPVGSPHIGATRNVTKRGHDRHAEAHLGAACRGHQLPKRLARDFQAWLTASRDT